MRSTERLFQIIQILRRSAGPATAAALAAEIEVSRRTIYRDIAELIAQRVPIEGAAGFGYVLADDYDMPPLALTPDEAEALALGAQWVARHPDAALARIALDAMAKIRFALPEGSRYVLEQPVSDVRPREDNKNRPLDTMPLRDAIRRGRVLAFRYLALDGQQSQRAVWPILLGYDEERVLLIAWCEERSAIRHFRVERMSAIEVLERKPQRRRHDLLRIWHEARGRASAQRPQL
ncbi:helix-turn-helix transcriptional regulator [Gluconacetobacter diazotrophicus]|uniref:helix-turn-helix transcriptional regulator n=1 Tax=Gluconacetobacter diazotrophicus TaxID=33996 RepID=UPI00119A64EB|nr:YafY family protein [Gluconacetobacter diazotrophicus]TWA98110.1 putative DNA-binding transcriptional regulator YafY [Gluconacetobacter diazotrophicus]